MPPHRGQETELLTRAEDAKDAASIAKPVDRGLRVTGQVIITVPGAARTFAIG